MWASKESATVPRKFPGGNGGPEGVGRTAVHRQVLGVLRLRVWLVCLWPHTFYIELLPPVGQFALSLSQELNDTPANAGLRMQLDSN